MSIPQQQMTSPQPSSDEINAFCDAAVTRDAAAVIGYLDRFGSAIIDKKDNEFNRAALQWVCGLGRTDMARLLLEHGASIEIRDEDDGSTPLTLAAATKSPSCVALLLEKGASINAQNREGETALIRAVSTQCPEIVRMLLEKGTDFELKESNGRTAIICSAMNGNVMIMDQLIKKGADINVIDRGGKTALDWAKIYKRENAINRLQKHYDELRMRKTELCELRMQKLRQLRPAKMGLKKNP